MKAVVAAFNQEKALVGAFSVITNLRICFGWIFLKHYWGDLEPGIVVQYPLLSRHQPPWPGLACKYDGQPTEPWSVIQLQCLHLGGLLCGYVGTLTLPKLLADVWPTQFGRDKKNYSHVKCRR